MMFPARQNHKLFLLVLLLTLFSAASCKVQVTLYAEALCPYCRQALSDVVAPLVDSELGGAFDFRYVAWGNARRTQDGVACQHGPAECRLDRVFNCAIKHSSGPAQWLPFLLCVEGKPSDEMEGAVGDCAQSAGLDAEDISTCAAGPEGEELEAQAADETDALNPKHMYVPWLVVNGVALGEDYGNLKKYICVALEGQQPDSCFTPPDANAALDGRRVGGNWQAAGAVQLSLREITADATDA